MRDTIHSLKSKACSYFSVFANIMLVNLFLMYFIIGISLLLRDFRSESLWFFTGSLVAVTTIGYVFFRAPLLEVVMNVWESMFVYALSIIICVSAAFFCFSEIHSCLSQSRELGILFLFIEAFLVLCLLIKLDGKRSWVYGS